MKKQIIFLSTLALIAFQSCQSQSEKSGGNNISDASEQGTSIQTASYDSTSAPVSIDKAFFLRNVMNYEKNTQEWVYEGDLPCIVDFYADWCPPCRISTPILEELAAEYAGKIKVYKVNVDNEQELAAVFGISNIPSFLFCPMKGNPTISSGIAQTPEDTKTMFKQQIETILFGSTASLN